MIVFGIILMGLGVIFLFTFGFDLVEKAGRSGDELAVFMSFFPPLLPFFFGLILIGIAQSWSGTYVQVFSDHMEGKALVGSLGVVTNTRRKEVFFLTFNRISHITVESNVLKIHADGKEYKILTDSKYANEVFRLYNSIQQSAAPTGVRFVER